MASCRGIRPYDKVRIMRKAETRENGWENSWIPCIMDDVVGTIQTVSEINGTNVRFEGNINGISGLGFPWFVLEVVR